MSKAKARGFRKRATGAEKLLWSKLRNRQVEGLKFRRQQPIGNRIVDFFCAEAQLAIEVDGSGHAGSTEQAEDLDRELELHEKGIRLVRFWNSEVFNNLGGVIDSILFAIDSERSPWATPQLRPHLGPLPAGEEKPLARGHSN
jgi:very-short-patch-repair endonuclease